MILTLLNDKIIWRVLLLISNVKGRGYKFNDFKSSLKINNSSLYKSLNKLMFYKVIKKDGVYYKVDFNCDLTQNLFELIDFDKKKFNNMSYNAIECIMDFLSRIDEELKIKEVYVFGSYVRKTNNLNSDIDVAIISTEEVDLFDIVYSLEEKCGLKLEIHNILEKNFSKHSMGLIGEIKRDGIKLI